MFQYISDGNDFRSLSNDKICLYVLIPHMRREKVDGLLVPASVIVNGEKFVSLHWVFVDYLIKTIYYILFGNFNWVIIKMTSVRHNYVCSFVKGLL